MKTLQEITDYYGPLLAKGAFELGAIRLSPAKPFTWASGYHMPIYNDNRQFLAVPKYRALIRDAFADMLSSLDFNPDNIAGTATAGIPHATSLADMLYKASEVFKRAIDAIIHFGTERHKSFFAPSEAADIKSVMQEYGETTEQQNAVGAWLCDYAESRQPFDEIKHRHTLKEVGDVAEGKYDWKIESIQQRLQR